MKKIVYIVVILCIVAAVIGVWYYVQNLKPSPTPPPSNPSSLSREEFINQMGNAAYQINDAVVPLRGGKDRDDTLWLNTDVLTVGNLTGNNAVAAATVINHMESGESYLVATVQQDPNSKAYRILRGIALGKEEITEIVIQPGTILVKTEKNTRTFTFTGTGLEEKK